MKKIHSTSVRFDITTATYSGIKVLIKPALTMLVFLLLFGQVLKAQPVWESTNSAYATAGTTVTVSITTGSNAYRMIMVGVSSRGRLINLGGAVQGEPCNNVSYGGDPMIYAGSQLTDPDAYTYIFYILDPPASTTDNVVVTFSSNLGNDNAGIVGVMSFYNVNQTDPVGSYTSSSGTSATPSLTVPSQTNYLVFDVVSVNDKNISDPTGRTSFWKINTPGKEKGAGSVTNGLSGSTVMNWTAAGNADWSMSGIAIKPMPIANLGISKTVNNPTPYIGATITFTLTASNSGPEPAPNVVVQDLLPSGYTYISHSTIFGSYNSGTGAWEIGTVNPGVSPTLTITVYVNAAGTYINAASVTGDVIDNTPGNNSANVGITVCQSGNTAPLFNN
ncbi:MAG TPA: DUF11 domain-containing protein [Bacteroidales bacterium]|nr:DUF11 domain-containing protein [Bacteroidales bacterium]